MRHIPTKDSFAQIHRVIPVARKTVWAAPNTEATHGAAAPESKRANLPLPVTARAHSVSGCCGRRSLTSCATGTEGSHATTNQITEKDARQAAETDARGSKGAAYRWRPPRRREPSRHRARRKGTRRTHTIVPRVPVRGAGHASTKSNNPRLGPTNDLGDKSGDLRGLDAVDVLRNIGGRAGERREAALLDAHDGDGA